MFLPLIALFLAWIFQEQLIYPGLFRTSFKLSFQNIQTKDGDTGCYYKEGNPGTPLWIVLGGNNSLPQDYQALASKTVNSYLLINYPGFGGTVGKMKPETTAELISNCLKAVQKPNQVINFICHSIGCAVGLNFLDKNPHIVPKRLVLLAPFWKLEEVIAKKYTFVLPESVITSLINHTWDNFEHIESLHPETDVTIVHGRNDRLIDWKQGERLAKKHKNAKFTLTDDDHNSIVGKTIKFV